MGGFAFFISHLVTKALGNAPVKLTVGCESLSRFVGSKEDCASTGRGVGRVYVGSAGCAAAGGGGLGVTSALPAGNFVDMQAVVDFDRAWNRASR